MGESETGESRARPARNGHKQQQANGQSSQLNLFATAVREENPVLDELATLKVAELTPLEAINKLYELQQKASKRQRLDS
jgi:DNA mismatch repair protein MutS